MTGEGMTGISGRTDPVGHRSSRSGMTLVEVMIAMVVIAIALLALLTLMTTAGAVQDDSRERTIAFNAARRIVEDMRNSLYLTELYANYKSGGTIGNEFWVDGIPQGKGSLQATVPPGEVKFAAQGTIEFPEDVPGKGLFNESLSGNLARDFGLPKDLNRNGVDTDTDVTVEALHILPVKVQVQWSIKGGKYSKVEVVTLITSR